MGVSGSEAPDTAWRAATPPPPERQVTTEQRDRSGRRRRTGFPGGALPRAARHPGETEFLLEAHTRHQRQDRRGSGISGDCGPAACRWPPSSASGTATRRAGPRSSRWSSSWPRPRPSRSCWTATPATATSTTCGAWCAKLEQRDVAAVCIEDKLFPKANSFIDGRRQPLADIDEFCGKLKAGKDAQTDERFSIVARVEALIAGHGMAEALRRAEAYRARRRRRDPDPQRAEPRRGSADVHARMGRPGAGRDRADALLRDADGPCSGTPAAPW